MAGVLSLLMAVFCLALPHTPPAKTVENPLAFLTAIKLARKPSFALMLVVAFLVSTELQFYYVLTPNFFHDEPGLSLSEKQLQGRVRRHAVRERPADCGCSTRTTTRS